MHQPPLQHLPSPPSFPSASISKTAAAEKVDRDYVGRILQLTLVAPDIVEAILDERQPAELGLPALMDPFPAEWQRQRAVLQAACSAPSLQRRAAVAGTRLPGAQSTVAPGRRTSSATLGNSAAKKAASSSGTAVQCRPSA